MLKIVNFVLFCQHVLQALLLGLHDMSVKTSEPVWAPASGIEPRVARSWSCTELGLQPAPCTTCCSAFTWSATCQAIACFQAAHHQANLCYRAQQSFLPFPRPLPRITNTAQTAANVLTCSQHRSIPNPRICTIQQHSPASNGQQHGAGLFFTESHSSGFRPFPRHEAAAEAWQHECLEAPPVQATAPELPAACTSTPDMCHRVGPILKAFFRLQPVSLLKLAAQAHCIIVHTLHPITEYRDSSRRH